MVTSEKQKVPGPIEPEALMTSGSMKQSAGCLEYTPRF
jgi:hypothetical protein